MNKNIFLIELILNFTNFFKFLHRKDDFVYYQMWVKPQKIFSFTQPAYDNLISNHSTFIEQIFIQLHAIRISCLLIIYIRRSASHDVLQLTFRFFFFIFLEYEEARNVTSTQVITIISSLKAGGGSGKVIWKLIQVIAYYCLIVSYFVVWLENSSNRDHTCNALPTCTVQNGWRIYRIIFHSMELMCPNSQTVWWRKKLQLERHEAPSHKKEPSDNRTSSHSSVSWIIVCEIRNYFIIIRYLLLICTYLQNGKQQNFSLKLFTAT